MKYGVILYTLKNEIKNVEDLKNILPKIRQLGYEGVEFTGYYDADPVTLRQLCEQNGLEILGTHLSIDELHPDKIDHTIAFAKGLGLDKIGVGMGRCDNKDVIENTALKMRWANKYGEDKGIKFYYHTHHFEFLKSDDGQYPIETIKKATYLEIDTYWSFYAKADTCSFLRENKEKILALHIKDGIKKQTKALGEGNNDLKSIIATAEEIGMEWLIVENDLPEPSGFEDITRSMKWLKENGYVK